MSKSQERSFQTKHPHSSRPNKGQPNYPLRRAVAATVAVLALYGGAKGVEAVSHEISGPSLTSRLLSNPANENVRVQLGQIVEIFPGAHETDQPQYTIGPDGNPALNVIGTVKDPLYVKDPIIWQNINTNVDWLAYSPNGKVGDIMWFNLSALMEQTNSKGNHYASIIEGSVPASVPPTIVNGTIYVHEGNQDIPLSQVIEADQLPNQNQLN